MTAAIFLFLIAVTLAGLAFLLSDRLQQGKKPTDRYQGQAGADELRRAVPGERRASKGDDGDDQKHRGH